MTVQVLKRRFTVDEFHRMGEAGIFAEDDRVELIDGEIIQMTPIGPRHASCVRRLDAILQAVIADRAIVGVQNPIRLGRDDEPQPDVVLLARRTDFYRAGSPGGISPPGSHRSVRDSLPSYGSSRSRQRAAGFAQAQCAKYRG